MTSISKPGLVSVIVASYNHAEFLEERIDSLINQTYKNIEIIVIDDCSKDGSLNVLRKYETEPKFNLIVRKKNAGWASVSNQGAKIAKGEYIIFANCDDSCESTMIEKLVESMDKNPSAGISFCRSKIVDEKGNILGDDYLARDDRFKNKCQNDVFIPKKEMTIFLLHSCVIPNLSAALFSKKCFEKSGGFTKDYKVCGDWDFYFRAIKQFDVAYIAMPLNKFRQHETTIRSNTENKDMYAEFFKLLLTQLSMSKLDHISRIKLRIRVIELLIRYISLNPIIALKGINSHLELIVKLDFITLLFIPFSFLSIGKTILTKKWK